jgi:hypothetical protein
MPDSLLAQISSGLWLELLCCTVEYKYIAPLGASAIDFGLHRAKRDIIITPTQTVRELLNCTGTKELTSAYMTNLRVLTSSKCRVLVRCPHREAMLPSYFKYLPQNLHPGALLDNLLRRAAPVSRFVSLSQHLKLFDQKARLRKEIAVSTLRSCKSSREERNFGPSSFSVLH